MEIKIGGAYAVVTNRGNVLDVIIDGVDGNIAHCHTVKTYGVMEQHQKRNIPIARLMECGEARAEIRRREDEKKAAEMDKIVSAFADSIEIRRIEITRELRRRTRKLSEDEIYQVVENMMFDATMPDCIQAHIPEMVERLRDNIRESDLYITTCMELVSDAETAKRIL